VTAIERTAYPRLKRNPSSQDLAAAYTPTDAELAWVRRTVRDGTHRLHLLIWLKCFQCLGYFPDLLAVPSPIIEHLDTCLGSDISQPLGYRQDRMLYRHHQAVRDYLHIQPFDDSARAAVIAILRTTAAVMDNPADLINVAMEELVRLRYELPAFSTLEHLVENVRTAVNDGLFAQVQARWTADETARLQVLLDTKIHPRRTSYQTIKDPPHSATLGHLRAHQRKLAWLLTLADTDRLLADVPAAKRLHWAAEARVLDAGAMNDILPPKRYVLMLCLIQQARVTTRDEVITMFIKRMSAVQQAAQKELVKLRESHLDTTLKVAAGRHARYPRSHYRGGAGGRRGAGVPTRAGRFGPGGRASPGRRCRAGATVAGDCGGARGDGRLARRLRHRHLLQRAQLSAAALALLP